ncbi:inosine-uridine preferring nucleoside hydrolase-like isoform X1 [Haliotis rubra]|uniref:inosine-uridine preferring nucleoside hydrolase-like isoform X1 n=1 Tax=Haliotis rubra TaxID=36100 RepID=UPI001EE5CF00|nr:inosine-uridine preferring nucleoside hydrolase-like isoform X1 [Haliotis rubra]XP_046557178.1 inosine-uridine preferring nucleoside hydrolase-like isoform X1 [Haliotis rubra]XP_046557185.1 inosine-uridine preferring nucleoside hydrolase-like isoform X1 [Haliotis rubra]
MKVIVDVDTGIDDATALMLLLSRADVEVLAITCVRGNIALDKVCVNTLRVLKACGKENIPVYRGADRPILDNEKDASHFHGVDGLGDATWSESVDIADLQSEHAVMAILRLINKHPGEITLIPLGPLTNIALALRLDPDLGKKLKEVFIMGGNTEARGNVTVSSEFNFYVDPEAAYICLSAFKAPLTIIPWESCLDTQRQIPWAVYDKWIALGTPKANFLKKITQHWIENIKVRQQPGFRSCDLFAMTTVLDRESILDKETVHATVELHGQLTRGQMVVDWKNRMGNEPNVTIVKKICVEKVTQFVTGMLQ